MVIVELQDVHKVYPLGKVEVEAVKGVSFSIEKGDFISIAGPSGSGKTTILNMIGCVDRPTQGTVIINGQPTKELSDRALTTLRHDTFALLKKAADEGQINFIGNIEGTDVYAGKAEVVVTDGFSGNILLKTTEGVAKYMMDMLKDVFYKNLGNKLAAARVKGDLKEMKKKLDPNEVGGTALLGISKPVIKAHGSSKAPAVLAACRQAVSFASSGFIGDITENVEAMKVSAAEAGSSD